MSYIDHHESLEALANHLVHEDCPHVFDEADDIGGHCYDCTLAHLEKMRARIQATVHRQHRRTE